jgi:hypothetical protein
VLVFGASNPPPQELNLLLIIMKLRYILFLLLIPVCFGFAQPAAVQQYSDFLPGGISHANHAALGGSYVGSSDAIWSVHGDVEVLSDNTVTTSSSGAGWFPLAPKAEDVIVQAIVRPQGVEWVALVAGGQLGPSFFDTAQVWVLLRETGVYQVMANGAKITVKQGNAPKFSSAGNLLELRHNKKENLLTVSINGEVVVDKVSLSALGFVPNVDTAGFRIHRGATQSLLTPELSSFKVSYKAEVAPRLSIRLNDLNVYAPYEPIILRMVGSGLSGASYLVDLQLIDYSEKIVWQNAFRAEVSGSSFAKVLTLPSNPRQGYFQLRSVVRDSQGRVLATTEKPLAVLPMPSVASASDNNPFGAMVFPHIAYPFVDKEKDALLMERIGLRYVRTHRLNWIQAQPKEDMDFQWEEMDKEVALYERHGLRIIATTAWPIPAWGSQARNMTTKEDKGLFMPNEKGMASARRFYAEMAARYRGKISYYEIGNEADTHFWLGSAAHYKEHDIHGILQDYFDYFRILARDIKGADASALIAPTTTSATEGHTYRPWLTTQLGLGMGKEMTAYGTHYSADLKYTLEKFTEHDVPPSLPIILTEIGGISRTLDGANPFGPEMKKSIRDDYMQIVSQLGSGANVRAVCKFLFREQTTYGGEGVIWAGLLSNDFSIRPSYVAYANLVSQLAGAKFMRPLNLTKRSSTGWAQGFAFERDGQQISVLFLHGTKPGRVTVNSAQSELRVADVMGNVSKLPVHNGKADIEMDSQLPIFVLGPIIGDGGDVEVPSDEKMREIVIHLKNPDFEESNSLSGWHVLINEQGSGQGDASGNSSFTVTPDTDIKHRGSASARFDAPTPTGWYGLTQDLPLDQIPRPASGEYLKFQVSLFAKGAAVHGKGLGYTLAFRRADFSRFYFTGSHYFGFGGTYDWKELAGENELNVWQDETKRLSLDIILGLSTGTVWVDDVKVAVQLWKKASAK